MTSVSVGREPCVWLPPIINDKTTPDYQRIETTFQTKFPEHLEAIEEVYIYNWSFLAKFV